MIRNAKIDRFVIFTDPSAIPEYLVKNNQSLDCHQMFGQWMVPCFDIELEIQHDEETDLDTDITRALPRIAKLL